MLPRPGSKPPNATDVPAGHGQSATCLGSVASALCFGGRYADALPFATEAVALTRSTSMPATSTVTVVAALAMAVSRQDPTRASELLDESGSDPASDNYGEASQLTLAAAMIGDWPRAARFAMRSIPLLHWVNQRPYLQIMLTVAARILAERDPEGAATIQGAAHTLVVSVDTASTGELRASRTRGEPGGVGFIVDASRATTGILTDAIGSERLQVLREHGTTIGTDTAVAYTLARLDAFLTDADN